ncbi:MAG: hypothetical protein R3B09_17470 [Nannocystaceae bacterium]
MDDDASLARRLLAALGPARGAAWAAVPGLDEAVAAAIDRARAAWPGLAVDPSSAIACLARAITVDGDGDAPRSLEVYRVGDLILAEQAAAGAPTAIAALQREIQGALPGALRSLGIVASTIDEVLADLLAYVLVGEGAAPPRILRYHGRGPLRRWLRTIAVRRAYRAIQAPTPGDDAPLEALAAGDDLERLALQGATRELLREAFVAALQGLTPRQRNLLRYHHLDRLSVDHLAALYRVHRATAARWVAAARAALLEGTRARLQGALGSDVDTVLRAIGDQLDVSLRRHLSADDEGEGSPAAEA